MKFMMFKISEFSKLTQVFVRMLRNYDEVCLMVSEVAEKLWGIRWIWLGQYIQLLIACSIEKRVMELGKKTSLFLTAEIILIEDDYLHI